MKTKKRKPIKSISRDGVGIARMMLEHNYEDKKKQPQDFSYRPYLIGTEFEVRRGSRKVTGE